MKFQWFASLSCLAMAVAGMVTLTSEAQAQRLGPSNPPGGSRIPVGPNPNSPPPPSVPRPAMTTVRCAGTVTVAEKNGRQAPIITWATNYFGDQYSPETRCQMVSSKLHNAVMANGGTFAGMRFNSGVVNSQLVVCVLGTGQYQCNSGNQLFTLKPENRTRVTQVLQELTNFSAKGTSGIVEDSGEGIQVDISDLEQELGTSEPAYAPQSPSQSAPNDTTF